MDRKIPQYFIGLVCAYATASLVHFIHNAEFLQAYPGLPASWTRIGVYLAWIGMSSIGLLGIVLLQKGIRRIGLLVIMIYALFGLDSLGHYIMAPFSAHTPAMHITILFEVILAGIVFIASLVLFIYKKRRLV